MIYGLAGTGVALTMDAASSLEAGGASGAGFSVVIVVDVFDVPALLGALAEGMPSVLVTGTADVADDFISGDLGAGIPGKIRFHGNWLCSCCSRKYLYLSWVRPNEATAVRRMEGRIKTIRLVFVLLRVS